MKLNWAEVGDVSVMESVMVKISIVSFLDIVLFRHYIRIVKLLNFRGSYSSAVINGNFKVLFRARSRRRNDKVRRSFPRTFDNL